MTQITRSIFVATFSLTLALMCAAHADSTVPPPVLTTIVPEQVFAPPGFNTNNQVQVILSGSLPSTCYRLAPALSHIDAATKSVHVLALAYFYPGDWCADIESPYNQVVDIGIIPVPGDYTVVLDGPHGRTKDAADLPVARAQRPSGDDYLYANVQDAYVIPHGPQANATLLLSGNLGNECMTLREVKVLERTRNIIEVLPLAEYRPGALCRPFQVPFEKTVSLPGSWTGKTLVYIRSLNGQSISKVTEL